MSLDAAGAITATIGAAGGSIQAKGADGSSYSLVIPQDSVPDGTEITMTPISSFDDGLGGSFGGGVQFAPEGLLLVHGATLTITPAETIPVDRQLAWGYTGNGAGVQVMPLGPDPNSIQIPLVHFSGVGVDNGGDSPPPSTNAAFYGQLIADVVAQVREAHDQPENDPWASQISSWLADYDDAIMSEEVPPGLNDDQAATVAIADLINWANLEETIFNFDALDIVHDTIYKLYEGMYQRAQQKCAAHDLSQLSRIIAIDTSEQLLGNVIGHADTEICNRFEIDFDSQLTWFGTEGSGSWNFEYTARVPVAYDANTLIVRGEDRGAYKTRSGTIAEPAGGGTVQLIAAHGDTFSVDKFSYSLDPKNPSPPTVIIDLHQPTETYRACANGCNTSTSSKWLPVFMQSIHSGNDEVAQLTLQWVADGGPLVAQGNWTQNIPNVISITTTIDVYHTPGSY